MLITTTAISVYQTGSSVLLKKYNDIDLLYIYETLGEMERAKKNAKRNTDYDIHYDYIRPFKIKLHSYIYHYAKLIKGKDTNLNDVNIFEHKSEYVNCLLEWCRKLPVSHKWWYHILSAYYIFLNNSYNLTEKQLDHIQQVHDNGIDCEMRSVIIKYLSSI